MTRRQSIIPALNYQEPLAALEWLKAAFSFETVMVITRRDDPEH